MKVDSTPKMPCSRRSNKHTTQSECPPSPSPPMRRTEVRTVLLLDSPALRPYHRLPHVPELQARYAIRVVPDWSALHDALRDAPPSTVAVVDPYHHTGDDDAPAARVYETLRRFPSVPLVAALDFRPGRAGEVKTLLEWGISEMVDLELERTLAAFLLRVRQAHARPLKRRMEAEIPRQVSANGLTLLRAAAEVAVDGGGALDVARLFGVETRTVAAWCEREGLPAPRRIQTWARTLLAAMLLEEPERSMVGVARACGYANDHALRRALRQLLGSEVPPRERLFAAANARFRAGLREARESARERRTAGAGDR